MADKQLIDCGASIETAYEGQPDTNKYTDAEKSKLSGIQAGAQVNTVTSVNGNQGAVTITKSSLGLGNVDNTTDSAKPVSTAQQTALDLKAPLSSPALTGNPTAPTPTAGDNDTSIATTAFVTAAITAFKAVANIWTRQQTVQGTDLTDASSISWNLDTQATTTLLMTSGVGATRVLANPTNLVKGGTYVLKITQDGAGSRALTYGNIFKWASGVAPVLSTAANAIDVLTFYSDGVNMYGTIQKGFA